MPSNRIKLLGVNIDSCTVDELHQQIQSIIDTNRHELVLNVNANALTLAHKLEWLRTFFNRAEIVFPDGAGVVFAARLTDQYLPGRITYADWMWEFGSFIEKKHYSIYFLGARPGIAEKAAINLRAKFPTIKLQGFMMGILINPRGVLKTVWC
jgi:N-acetylglucosaminyldiphosphoundecaprenol N-acetyl-beta-D-mannosaminyltransferase